MNNEDMIAGFFATGNEKKSHYEYGTVVSVANGACVVSIGGIPAEESSHVTCSVLNTAKVHKNAKVLVLVMPSQCIVIGTLTTNVNKTACDYSVEQGTKNGWNYVKWASGRMECDWADERRMPIKNKYGSEYSGESMYPPDYPFAFKALPAISVEVTTAEQGAPVPNGRTLANESVTNAPRIIPTAVKQYTDPGLLRFHVIARGRWK